jgi:processing peptidase subunit beta
MGVHLNAYTSREQTTYCAKVLKKDVSAAVYFSRYIAELVI